MIDENLICQVDVRQRKNNFSLMENTKRNRDNFDWLLNLLMITWMSIEIVVVLWHAPNEQWSFENLPLFIKKIY